MRSVAALRSYMQHIMRDFRGRTAASKTATFAAASVRLDAPRWKGTPFVLVAGKDLGERRGYVRISFRSNPGTVCVSGEACNNHRSIVFHIQGGVLDEPGVTVTGTFPVKVVTPEGWTVDGHPEAGVLHFTPPHSLGTDVPYVLCVSSRCIMLPRTSPRRAHAQNHKLLVTLVVWHAISIVTLRPLIPPPNTHTPPSPPAAPCGCRRAVSWQVQPACPGYGAGQQGCFCLHRVPYGVLARLGPAGGQAGRRRAPPASIGRRTAGLPAG